MSKLRVLQFPVRNNKGGVTQYVLNNWNFIDREKIQFDFVTLSSKLDFETELTDSGCKVYYLSCYAEENEEQFKKELSRVLDHGYDVIHIHTGVWKSFHVEKLAAEKGIKKIIIHAHNAGIGGDIGEEERIWLMKRHKELKKQVSVEMATDFWACSHEAAEWLYGNQIPQQDIRIMRYCIDVDKFRFSQKTREEYRNKLGLSDKFVIGNIGRFVYQKNHEFLIELFQSVAAKMPNAVLLLIGIGELQNHIRNKVREAGLENRVEFLGKRDDVAEIMQAMDLFLLPSRFEGFGIVLLEAQSAMLPCVASDTIPKEAAVGEGLVRLPLELELWKREVEMAYKCWKRIKPDYDKLELHNVRSQMHVLEDLYGRE